MPALRSYCKLALFVLLCLITLVLQGINRLLFSQSKVFFIVPHFFYGCICLIYQIRIKISGTINTQEQTIFVANHLSYIDIAVLGKYLNALFVAKDDVKSWPVLGLLAQFGNTVFIARNRDAAPKAIADMQTAVLKEKSLIIFPEGTSSQGTTVLPFKSSLFSLFLDETIKNHAVIQPISICLKSINNSALRTAADYDTYAWYGAMTLIPHLMALGRCKELGVELIFHPVVNLKNYTDRKLLANNCHKYVMSGVINNLPAGLDFILPQP